MKRNLFILFALISFTFFLGSCGDENDTNAVDEEWKVYNQQQTVGLKDKGYKEIVSGTKNGSIYWKKTTAISDGDVKSLKITQSGNPYITDSVVCRYTGWFYLKDGTKYTFDSTEGNANAQLGRGFRLNNKNVPITQIMGWTDMLINMDLKETNEVEVCIPYQLAYGTYGSSPIPGYTTLWFNIKLLKIIADNDKEWN